MEKTKDIEFTSKTKTQTHSVLCELSILNHHSITKKKLMTQEITNNLFATRFIPRILDTDMTL